MVEELYNFLHELKFGTDQKKFAATALQNVEHIAGLSVNLRAFSFLLRSGQRKSITENEREQFESQLVFKLIHLFSCSL